MICPSLPGYGFSDKPNAPGWGVEKIALAWDTLRRASARPSVVDRIKCAAADRLQHLSEGDRTDAALLGRDAYRNIVYWNELDRGGRFAAFEQPELFVKELRACWAVSCADGFPEDSLPTSSFAPPSSAKRGERHQVRWERRHGPKAMPRGA